MTLHEDQHINLITNIQIRVISYEANAEQDSLNDQKLKSF